MATVYRVEHPSDHIGPYNHKWPHGDNLLFNHSDDYKNHPAVYLDMEYAMDDDDRCGFRDMRQMFRWFGGWMPVMIRNGFRVAVYRDVEILDESPLQVVFRISERETP